MYLRAICKYRSFCTWKCLISEFNYIDRDEWSKLGHTLKKLVIAKKMCFHHLVFYFVLLLFFWAVIFKAGETLNKPNYMCTCGQKGEREGERGGEERGEEEGEREKEKQRRSYSGGCKREVQFLKVMACHDLWSDFLLCKAFPSLRDCDILNSWWHH